MANGVSNAQIDQWYECARRCGAIGGKIAGAGGGGFLLLYAPPDRHGDICRALSPLQRVAIHLEQQGSKIIYIEENGRD